MACCDRVFPSPDPMMRFIDPDEGPYEFWKMEPNERSRRARSYLISLAAGFNSFMSWIAAITDEPEGIELIHSMVDINADDKKIEGFLRDLRAREARVAFKGD